jgi:outer membrane murein-binding lipoprotein Lpp
MENGFMKTFLVAMVATLFLSGTAVSADAKLSKEDFDLLQKNVNSLNDDVTALKKAVKDLSSKNDELMSRLDKMETTKIFGATVPTVAPVKMARPDGEGWTYNASDNSWSRILPGSYSYPAYSVGSSCSNGVCTPTYQYPTAPTYQYPQYVFPAGGCPNGNCPRR